MSEMAAYNIDISFNMHKYSKFVVHPKNRICTSQPESNVQ